jgi:hypothetical protein
MENQAKTIQEQSVASPAQSAGITKAVKAGKITIDSVAKGTYDGDGEVTAQLRQVVTVKSKYPKKQIANNMQDNIFSVEDFGFEMVEYENEENRVAWINVPEGSTVKSVAAQLKKFPDARLYKVLSNKPILTDNQKYAINNGITTIDVFAASQAVRIPTTPDTEEQGTAGDLVPDPAGKIQYRSVFFSKDGKADQDNRTAKADDFYAPQELANEFAELTGTNTVADIEGGQRM